MRVYICVPMAGKPNLNREAADRAAKLLQDRGDTYVIPHDIEPYWHEGPCPVVYGGQDYPTPDGIHDGGCYLRGDVAFMAMCDAVYRLPGWEKSKGCTIESAIAQALGIPIEDA